MNSSRTLWMGNIEKWMDEKYIKKNLTLISNVLFNYNSFWHVPISIKYINDYFICPVESTIIESLDDSIWSFLRENVNDLV